MRRVLLALSGTVAGLVMLLSFKSHAASTAAAGIGAGAAGSSAAGSGGSGGSGAGSVTGTGQSAYPSAAPSSGRSGSGPSGAGSGGAAATVVSGRAISTMYGPMQVQATLAGGRITKVTVLQHTDVGAESEQIDATAIPQLTREALAAQSARIDAVSGASYTSSGYIQSLQSALDKTRA
jgi:hypothetical protein